MTTYGNYGDYGFKNNSIYQPNKVQSGEVKKTDSAPAETIDFNKNDGKEFGFDLLTQNAGSAYGKALTLSTNVQINKAFTQGLNDKELAFLQKELNRPGAGSIREFGAGMYNALEATAEFS